MPRQVANCDGSTCVSPNSSAANPHINYGAMVEGPTVADVYNDNRTWAGQAGVHLDTSAGFAGESFCSNAADWLLQVRQLKQAGIQSCTCMLACMCRN